MSQETKTEVKSWTTIDKSAWAVGPWQSEPDKMQWTDKATGFSCLIVRGPSGALCGYVGIPDGHPAFEQDYDNVDVRAHGGLTFASFCQHTDNEATGVCHVPEPGQPDRVWWLGFDCAHSGDISPKYDRVFTTGYDVYRDVDYVTREVTQLAAQLAAITKAEGGSQ